MRVAVCALLGLLTLAGCGGPSAKVTGTVTCGGKPVSGSILFSPKGEDESNKGPAVSAILKEDGSYELVLPTIGKHTVVISPSDVKFHRRAAEVAYPCDLTPKEWDVTAGDNKIVIELTNRKP